MSHAKVDDAKKLFAMATMQNIVSKKDAIKIEKNSFASECFINSSPSSNIISENWRIRTRYFVQIGCLFLHF